MDPLDQLREWIDKSSRIVVFTGAGVSTKSGIPDYRSKGGIYESFQPVTLQEFLASEEKRKEFWSQKRELFEQYGNVEPNEAHHAIVRLEERDKLLGLITQNIDGLHQLAGSSPEKVLEIHGTAREVICLTCGEMSSWMVVFDRLQSGEEIPLCECGGFLKPNIISFGQNLDPQVLDKAFEWVEACDLLLAAGSTLVVEPAASLPVRAKEAGSRLVIVNLTATPLDKTADLVIRDEAGDVLQNVTADKSRE
jgi:NAD-dependent deacetylase